MKKALIVLLFSLPSVALAQSRSCEILYNYQKVELYKILASQRKDLTESELLRAKTEVESAKDDVASFQPACDADRAADRAERDEADRISKLPGAKIGMSQKTVVDSTNWGKPGSINRTTTRSGTSEQWVYGNGTYLYFSNGKLIAIQN